MTGVIGLTLILLSGCGAADASQGSMPGSGSEIQKGQSSDMNSETMSEHGKEEQEQEHPDAPTDDPASGKEKGTTISEEGAMPEETEDYPAAYERLIEESGSNLAFSLIYLDDDDIPELVAGDRGYDIYSVYTARDGEAICLVSSIETRDFSYCERKGVITTFAIWNGGGDEGGYGRTYYHETIAGGYMPVLSYSYNATYDENGNYTGEGVTQYFYFEEETVKEMYDKTLETWGITESECKSCMENAVSAEEMLTLLRKGTESSRAAYESFLAGNLFRFEPEDIRTWRLDSWRDTFLSGGDLEYTYLDLNGDGAEELLVQYAESPEAYNGVFHYEGGRLYCWQHDGLEGSCRDYPLRDGTMVRQYDYGGASSYTLFRYRTDGSEVKVTDLFIREELINPDSTDPCPYYEVGGMEVDKNKFEEQLKNLITDQRLEVSAWTAL